jgi:hypothetical protein
VNCQAKARISPPICSVEISQPIVRYGSERVIHMQPKLAKSRFCHTQYVNLYDFLATAFGDEVLRQGWDFMTNLLSRGVRAYKTVRLQTCDVYALKAGKKWFVRHPMCHPLRLSRDRVRR